MFSKILSLVPRALAALHNLLGDGKPATPTTPAVAPAPHAHPAYLITLGGLGLALWRASMGDTAGALDAALTSCGLGSLAHVFLHTSSANPQATVAQTEQPKS